MLVIKCSFVVILILSNYNRHVVADDINTQGPRLVAEGDDALLTCVIMGAYRNDTVIWRKGPTKILSAGLNRVTNDKRISILHDDAQKDVNRAQTDGDVWVLLIKNVKPEDSDVYVCEVNSEPPLKSFHPLRIKSKDGTFHVNPSITDEKDPSDLSPPNIDSDSEYHNFPPSVTHDYTECCESFNVSTKCLGFCSIHNILDGTTGIEPEACENDFTNIIKCMADGRNHMPCCEKKKIPDLCQDMCRGEYTPFTDLLRSRISCAAHTIPGLECILEGVQKIPSAPKAVFVEPINEKSLQISWLQPEHLADTVKNYKINLTILQSFDEDYLANNTASTISVTVPAELNTTTINNLQPFTMYSVFVTSENEYGSSLPSTRKRALTLKNDMVNGGNSIAVIPKLPDVRGCCMSQGITHRLCLDKLCDPVNADFTEVPDLMVCAPWANITFSCLANNIDHTPCCKSRGMPEVCLPFCDGTVKTINFNSFKCLQYMSDYSSCLLQGYGVLPSAPTKLKASLISSNYAILEWKHPKVLSDTVRTYHLNLRKLGSGDEYTVTEKSIPPIILDNLDANSIYEAFIVAVNAHGKSYPSPRLIFQTKPLIEADPVTPTYNMTTCCKYSGLLPQCMSLCSYDIRMSDLQTLGSACIASIGAVVRCAAGGRDHSQCCSRRGVSNKCLPICKGVLSHPTECISYAGNIIQCLEEGTGNIPGPVENLQATSVTNNSISLSWSAFHNDTDNSQYQADLKDYLVQYGKVDNMTMYEIVIKLDNEIATTDTEIELTNLEAKTLYRIMVIARGTYGNSLPSSMLLINTSTTENDAIIYGAPSPPHTLSVSSHAATYITVNWQPPEFAHPHEKISYRLFHRSGNNVTIADTKMLWARLNRLAPNSQHIFYIVAIGSKGTSLPSETLVSWTDPALPAVVDPPTVHPSDFVSEGSSMTILCLALGNPVPHVKLYVGGHLVREETTRHLVTTVHNISVDMEHVSCYADNGYGVPMQTSKKISINFAPKIQAAGITVASLGDNVELKCSIKSKPIPKTMFWRDHDGRIPVIQSGNYDMTVMNDIHDPSAYVMVLRIMKLTNEDVGDYFCHAENALGSVTRPVSVRIRNSAPITNISECCAIQNVSSACLDACSFYLDIEAIIDRAECIADFDKLMKCASDGSDHRGCCAQKDVPRKCLNWCRGEPVISGAAACAIQYTKTIVGCFQENHNRLPGPPQNVNLQKILGDEVTVSWEPPVKNPTVVEGYRVFWHSSDYNNINNDNITSIAFSGLGTSRLDAKETSITISGLQHNVHYELVVKAGNHYGASVLSEPLRFTLDDHISSHSTGHGSVMGGIFAGLLAIIALVVVAAFLFIKSKKLKNKNANGGVAFENPSYLRETNVEQVHIQTISTNRQEPTSVSNNSAPVIATSSIPTASEVNPTLYEEYVKLGKEKGFKKLVS